MSKPVLSSRLMGLKFMQRAAEKEKKAEVAEAAEQRDAEAHWVVEGARTRCVVLAEGDPPPSEAEAAGGSGAAGRLSFGGFNAGTEQLVADATAAQAAAAAEAGNPGGKAVSDEAMAATLRRQGRQPGDKQRGHKHEQQQGGQRQGKSGGKHRRDDDQQDGGGHRGGGRGGSGKRPRARYFG
ncbi:hypothetical protein ABPG75_006827 [Micractinium tetrahymenae]